MEASTNIKDEIRKLRIDKAQRPTAPTAAARLARSGARPRRRLPLVLIGVGVAIGGGYWAWGRLAPGIGSSLRSTPEVRLITVTARSDSALPPVLTATGKIVSDHKVQVATKVSGQIKELMFEQGDRVEQGQIIARVEKTNYIARRDNAKAAFERAKARLEYLEANFKRITGLHTSNDAGDIEFINVKSEFEAAKAQADADEAMLREAQWWLEECEVRPIAGVVLQRNVEVGDFVAAQGGFGGMANSQFGAVADMNMLRVEVDVSELDITRITKDMPCTVTPDAYKDRKYAGHVMWLDPAANYSKATVQVKVRIENPDEFLRVEGSARVDFGSKPAQGTPGTGTNIWVVRSAVIAGEKDEAGAVFVYADGRLHKSDVKIGRRTDREYEILSGLKPGDRIGADPKDYEDGQRAMAAGEKS